MFVCFFAIAVTGFGRDRMVYACYKNVRANTWLTREACLLSIIVLVIQKEGAFCVCLCVCDFTLFFLFCSRLYGTSGTGLERMLMSLVFFSQ